MPFNPDVECITGFVVGLCILDSIVVLSVYSKGQGIVAAPCLQNAAAFHDKCSFMLSFPFPALLVLVQNAP